MSKFKYTLIGLGLALAVPLLAQTPTIFNLLRVNTQSDLRGEVLNATGVLTVNDDLTVDASGGNDELVITNNALTAIATAFFQGNFVIDAGGGTDEVGVTTDIILLNGATAVDAGGGTDELVIQSGTVDVAGTFAQGSGNAAFNVTTFDVDAGGGANELQALTDIINIAAELNVDAGGANDELNISAGLALFPGNATVNGTLTNQGGTVINSTFDVDVAGGTDELNIASALATFPQAVTINGQFVAADLVTLSDTDAIFRINDGRGIWSNVDNNFNPLCFEADGQAAGEESYGFRIGTGGDFQLGGMSDDCGTFEGTAIAMSKTGTNIDSVRLITNSGVIQGSTDGGSTNIDMTPQSGTFVATFDDACTTSPTVTFDYQRIGNLVVLMTVSNSGFTCTGDDTDFQTTGTPVPVSLRPSTNAATGIFAGFTNNGTATLGCMAVLTTGNIIFGTSAASAACTYTASWTAAGARGVPLASSPILLSYMLGNP